MTDMEQLGRRAVACSGWRWLPGMALKHGGKLCDGYQGLRGHGEDDDGTIHLEYATGNQWVRPENRVQCYPDLTDAATLGCLLALVRDAWGEADAAAVREANEIGQWWVVRNFGGDYFGEPGKSEAEALVAALEGASG